PYRVYGGLRFFERQEIKHVLAYLRLIASRNDDGALLRVVNFPPRGIGTRSLELLQEAAVGGSLFAAVQSIHAQKNAKLTAFAALIDAMARVCETLPLPEQVEHVITQSGLVAYYEAEKNATERVENLNELVAAAVAFIKDNEDPSLIAFLTHAALEAGEHQAGAADDALQLMTVHAAKGLEFHSVFLSGLEEGLFPHENSMHDPDGLEEERRLMYVAITRARQRLYLSFAQNRMLHGQQRYAVASRFLGEIPRELVRSNGPSVRYRYPGSAFEARPATAEQNASQFRIGQNVVHPTFGPGVIVHCEGRGADTRVQVNFGRTGTKWLALEYANLNPA
ncbi:MAG: 3'-5' exonuclease, partial [Burkholderiales bacterium]